MMPHVKKTLLICLAVELVGAAFVSAGACLLRRGERDARRAWRENPTAETRAALDAERAITWRHRGVLTGVLFGGMALITVPAVLLLSRPRSLRDDTHTPNAA
jgi:hypothetical protein